MYVYNIVCKKTMSLIHPERQWKDPGSTAHCNLSVKNKYNVPGISLLMFICLYVLNVYKL